MSASRTLKELVAEVRARCADPTPIDESALVALWRRETDALARAAIVGMAIHGEDMAVEAAAAALVKGVTPSVVADSLEEADRRYGGSK